MLVYYLSKSFGAFAMSYVLINIQNKASQSVVPKSLDTCVLWIVHLFAYP